MTKIFAVAIFLIFAVTVKSSNVGSTEESFEDFENISKIILPHKLRYLENMLNAEVVAKAAKIRQRLEANPNAPDSEKSWPMLLAQYQEDKKQSLAHNGFYIRRPPNL